MPQETLEYSGPKIGTNKGDERGSKQIISHNNDRLREVRGRIDRMLDEARGSLPNDVVAKEPHQPDLRSQVRQQQDLITQIESGLDDLYRTLFNEDN